MKTTLGVALTPPTAAALIAGACVLAAAFLPTYHACVPDQTRIPPIVANPPAIELPKLRSIPAKAVGLKAIQAKPVEFAPVEFARPEFAPIKFAPAEPMLGAATSVDPARADATAERARAAATPEPGNSARGQR